MTRCLRLALFLFLMFDAYHDPSRPSLLFQFAATSRLVPSRKIVSLDESTEQKVIRSGASSRNASHFLIAFFHFMSIFTPSWARSLSYPPPLLWGFSVLYSELSAFAWMGALGTTVFC